MGIGGRPCKGGRPLSLTHLSTRLLWWDAPAETPSQGEAALYPMPDRYANYEGDSPRKHTVHGDTPFHDQKEQWKQVETVLLRLLDLVEAYWSSSPSLFIRESSTGQLPRNCRPLRRGCP